MNTETTKITAVEVMTTGAEIVKMSANEQLVAYGYLMGLVDRAESDRRKASNNRANEGGKTE